MLHPKGGTGQNSAEVSTTVYSASKSVLKSVVPGKPTSGTGTGGNTILIEDASMSAGGGSQMLGALAEVNSESANSTSSLFERTPFQDFTSRKFNEILSQHDFSSLIRVREEALQFKQETENRMYNKLLKKKRLSPRTY